MGRHPGFDVVSAGYRYWDGLFGVAVFCTNLNKANEIISAEPNIWLVNSWDGVKGHAAGHDWNDRRGKRWAHGIQPNRRRVYGLQREGAGLRTGRLLLGWCRAED